jgi:hypothetical protein
MRLPRHGCGVCSVAVAGRQCCSPPRSRVYLTAGWRLQRRAPPRSRDCLAAGLASAASPQHVVEKCRSLPRSRVYLATCAAPASSYGARLQRCLPPCLASPRVRSVGCGVACHLALPRHGSAALQGRPHLMVKGGSGACRRAHALASPRVRLLQRRGCMAAALPDASPDRLPRHVLGLGSSAHYMATAWLLPR